MTPDPRFSVLVATYERPDLLRDAIASVMCQTVPDLELIVVDDASPTPATVPADPRIRLIRRDRNGGPAAAWNNALGHARGRYVAFLGDDDRFTPDRLALADLGHRSAPIVVCWHDVSEGPAPRRRLLEGSVADSILEGPTPSLGVTSVERTLAPRFDERFVATQDAEWWLRAAARGQVRTVPRVGYLQTRHLKPRHGNDLRAHLDAGLLLLEIHEAYFRAHPSSAAHRWLMVWQHAQSLGEYRIARRAAWEALRLHPHPRAIKRLIRSLRPESMVDKGSSLFRKSIGRTT